MVRDGRVSNGMVRAGMVSDGMVRDGMVRNGMVRDSMVRDCMVRDGMVRDGMVNDEYQRRKKSFSNQFPYILSMMCHPLPLLLSGHEKSEVTVLVTLHIPVYPHPYPSHPAQ